MAFKRGIAWNRMIEIMLIWWFASIKFIRFFLKFSCVNVYLNDSLCNFNFTGKTVPFPSADVIIVALFCCCSVFLLRKVSSCFFPHIFKKIAKPKWKRSFTELLKGYICYIFIIIISNISNHQVKRFLEI